MTQSRLAARCLHLRVTMGSRPGAGLVNLCQHIVRDGMECVGPFMDDYPTTCGLWETAAREASIPSR
ncbi:MAG: hypothetical protein ACKVVT_05585 [Dehalococcoidia bacterium]